MEDRPISEPAAVRVANFRRTILFALGVFLLYVFLGGIVSVVLQFFLAFLAAVVLNVPARWLAARGVPRGLSVAGVALLILGGLAAAAYFAGPPLVDQSAALVQSVPERLGRLQGRLQQAAQSHPALQGFVTSGALQTDSLLHRAAALLPRLGRYTLSFLNVVASALFVLVAALYMVASPQPLLRGLIGAVPPPSRPQAVAALKRIVEQVEAWALATLILMAIVGTASGLGLWAVGVPNPLLFGLVAAVGEAIPIVGPIASAVPPMVVALADAPAKALWVAGVFLVVQQVEGNLLVPLIMGKTVKLHPVSILFFVLALGGLLGLLGSLLAIPTAIIVKVLYEEFYAKGQPPEPDSGALDDSVQQILGGGARKGSGDA